MLIAPASHDLPRRLADRMPPPLAPGDAAFRSRGPRLCPHRRNVEADEGPLAPSLPRNTNRCTRTGRGRLASGPVPGVRRALGACRGIRREPELAGSRQACGQQRARHLRVVPGRKAAIEAQPQRPENKREAQRGTSTVELTLSPFLTAPPRFLAFLPSFIRAQDCWPAHLGRPLAQTVTVLRHGRLRAHHRCRSRPCVARPSLPRPLALRCRRGTRSDPPREPTDA